MQSLVVAVPVTEAVRWNNELVRTAPRTDDGRMVLRNIYEIRRLAKDLHDFEDELDAADLELLSILDAVIAKSFATEWFGPPKTALQRRIVRAVAHQRAARAKAPKPLSLATVRPTALAVPRERRAAASSKSSSRSSPRQDDPERPLTRLQVQARLRNQVARARLALLDEIERHCPCCDTHLPADAFAPGARWCRRCKALDQAARRRKAIAA